MFLVAICCPWLVIAVSRIKRGAKNKSGLLDALLFGGIFTGVIVLSLL